MVGTVRTEGREKTRKWEAKRNPSTQVPIDTPLPILVQMGDILDRGDRARDIT